MDTCPTEVVTRIIEYACCDDFGKTARRIGVVSKFFRAIAERFEFCAITVSGLTQLLGVIARVQSSSNVHGPEKTLVDTRYLFISELKQEHAIAADKNFRNSIEDYLPRGSFWRTRMGIEAEAYYRNHSDEFWGHAEILVRWTAPNVRTLYLLSSENWFPSRGSSVDRYISPKVLGVLSGVEFPVLVTLTVNHNAINEIRGFRNCDSSFLPPSTPSLRSLHIRSPIFMDASVLEARVHPLLSFALSDDSLINRLIICEDRMWTAQMAMRTIFGEGWREHLSDGLLPGTLKSVILQQGIMPHFGSTVGYTNYQLWTQAFVDTVAELRVTGLEAQHPTPRFPGKGKREYELLLAEWKEECLADV